MGLEKLYEESKTEYDNITMYKIMRNYVDLPYQVSFYLSIVFFFIFGLIMMYISYQNKPEFQLLLFSLSVIIILMGFGFHMLYIKELKSVFSEKFNLNSTKNINYKYHHYYSQIQDNELLKSNLQHLIDFSNIKLEISTRGFLFNPIVVLSISFIMAISVNVLTEDITKNANFIFSSILLACSILYIIFITNTSSSSIGNKDLAFQFFLKKTQFDFENKNIKINL